MNKVLNELVKMPPSDVVFLCGAGVSLDSPTSLPTVYRFVESILTNCGLEENKITKVLNQFGYKSYRFESLIDGIRKNCDKELIIANVFKSDSFNEIHYFLANMIEKGASVITTNFDNCIENALLSKNIELNNDNRIVYDGNDLIEDRINTNNVLIKIHGSHSFFGSESPELVITISALAKTTKAFALLPKWQRYIKELLFDKTLVVIGYSCSDDFDIVPLLYESKPKDIIWLNYKHKNNMPIREMNIDNLSVKNLSKVLPLKYYSGQIIPFLRIWIEKQNGVLKKGANIETYTVEQYIKEHHSTKQCKNILCNEILLSCGFYEDIISLGDMVSQGQKVKALFRLGKYDDVINICNNALSHKCNMKVKGELRYYLSSALYYKNKYPEAIQEAKKCCLIAFKERDRVFFLHSLINYASINYVYATTLDDIDKKAWLIDKSIRKYKSIIKNANGMSIEAEANALWGLGDIAIYLNNLPEAEIYLQRAYDILERIGNVYAMTQLSNTLSSIKNK